MRGPALALSLLLVVGCSSVADPQQSDGPQPDLYAGSYRYSAEGDWLEIRDIENHTGEALRLVLSASCQVGLFTPRDTAFESVSVPLPTSGGVGLYLGRVEGSVDPRAVGGPVACSFLAVDERLGLLSVETGEGTTVLPLPQAPEPTPAPLPGVPLEPID